MDDSYKVKAYKARKKVLQMVHFAKTSHIASNFSCIDIATVLYENLGEFDEVVWSKGWAAATIYYFLALQGKIPYEDLDKFPNEPYIGLAETSVPGVWANGGAVGHGTPIAVGMALAKKKAGEPGKIFCILSDGELNEGTVWESVMMAYHHKLDNLVFIVDANRWQAMGRTKEVIDLDPIENRFRGFGWFAVTIDGHKYDQIQRAVTISPKVPYVIVAETIKGKGVSFFEDHLLYHYKHIEEDEYEKALEELERNVGDLGNV